jgi:hypothetical protein
MLPQMSREEIHRYAQENTPDEIHVPNSWPALIVWAVGKFGVSILLAASFAYAVVTVYADGREREVAFERLNEKVLFAFQANASASLEVAQAVREMSREIDDMQKNRQ